MCNHLEN